MYTPPVEQRTETPAGQSPAPLPHRRSPIEAVRSFLRTHGRKLWWIHSAYALILGIGIVVFAHRGFSHARWLAVSVGGAWLLVVVFFRTAQSHAVRLEEAGTRMKLRFYVMSYVLKNLYQGMLFFLLPFYWQSATWDSANVWAVILLAVCAVVSTVDLVFDRIILQIRALASIFHAITLFACLNLVIPALFPNTRTLATLLWASAIATIAFLTFHVRVAALRDKRYFALFSVFVVFAMACTYALRRAIPPVPMHLASAAVGPTTLDDGRLSMQVTTLHSSAIRQLLAVTDIVIPGGKGDRLHHVWRLGNAEVHRASEDTSKVEGPNGTVRLRSNLTEGQLPEHLAGAWHVDVETEDGQLVGRVAFHVVD